MHYGGIDIRAVLWGTAHSPRDFPITMAYDFTDWYSGAFSPRAGFLVRSTFYMNNMRALGALFHNWYLGVFSPRASFLVRSIFIWIILGHWEHFMGNRTRVGANWTFTRHWEPKFSGGLIITSEHSWHSREGPIDSKFGVIFWRYYAWSRNVVRASWLRCL